MAMMLRIYMNTKTQFVQAKLVAYIYQENFPSQYTLLVYYSNDIMYICQKFYHNHITTLIS